MIPKIPFTKEGFEKIQAELKDLLARRVGAVQELTTARDMGDRSENGAYKSARFKLSGLDRIINRTRYLVHVGYVVESPGDGVIAMGSRVTLTVGDEFKEFVIVGPEESDLAHGRISFLSPVGKALVGKTAGQTVKVRLPKGEVEYEIVSVC